MVAQADDADLASLAADLIESSVPATKVTSGAAMSDFLFGETARRFRQRRQGRGSDKERGAGGGSTKQ